jgi:hypothetical protein
MTNCRSYQQTAQLHSIEFQAGLHFRGDFCGLPSSWCSATELVMKAIEVNKKITYEQVFAFT